MKILSTKTRLARGLCFLAVLGGPFAFLAAFVIVCADHVSPAFLGRAIAFIVMGCTIGGSYCLAALLKERPYRTVASLSYALVGVPLFVGFTLWFLRSNGFPHLAP